MHDNSFVRISRMLVNPPPVANSIASLGPNSIASLESIPHFWWLVIYHHLLRGAKGRV